MHFTRFLLTINGIERNFIGNKTKDSRQNKILLKICCIDFIQNFYPIYPKELNENRKNHLFNFPL